MKKIAIICDIDGTLTKMKGRGPYDWDKVGQDEVNKPVADIVQTYGIQGVKIIILTGRDGVCEKATKEWLEKHSIFYDYFYIRPKDNTEKDIIIKRRIFEKHIKDKFNILFALDDRDQVVEMWRSLGLTCLQVDYGDF